MPFFQKIFADNFRRLNETPLNPAHWAILIGFPDGLQVLNNEASPIIDINSDNGSGQYFTGSLPNDQYAEVTLGDNFDMGLSPTYAESDCFVRVSPDQSTGVDLFLFSNQDGQSAGLFVSEFGGVLSSLIFAHFVPRPGDRFKIAAIGSTVYCYYNDVLVFQGPIIGTSGVAGTYLFGGTSQLDARMAYFECGAASLTPFPLPASTTSIALPFSRRTTVATAIFACLGIAAPSGAPVPTPQAGTVGAFALYYAQLANLYPTLIRQDVANQQSVLDTAVASAFTIVTNLNELIQATFAVGDAGIKLNGMKAVVANALGTIQNALNDSGE